MKTAYINGIILNGYEDMVPTPDLVVLVDGETIAGIVPAGEVPAEYTAVDLRGSYLMPGLINLHVHIPGSGKPAKKQADTNKAGEADYQQRPDAENRHEHVRHFRQDGADERGYHHPLGGRHPEV